MQCFPDHLLGDHLCMFSRQTLKLLLFPLISSHILLLQFIVSTKQCVSNIFPFSIAVRHVSKVLCYILAPWFLFHFAFQHCLYPENKRKPFPLVPHKPFSCCLQGMKHALSFHFLFWSLQIQSPALPITISAFHNFWGKKIFKAYP